MSYTRLSSSLWGGEPFSLFENLNFESTDDEVRVSVAGESPQRRELIKLLGNMVNSDTYWDVDSGKLDYSAAEPMGFYAFGRYAPGTSLLSMLDVLDPGKEFQYAGAGKETVDKALEQWHQAYGPGHETMLRSLMNIPAIARMVKGHDPSNGKDNTRNAHIVQDVLRQHKRKFGAEYVTGRDERGRKVAHNTAFDTLPKLMAFIVNVNEAFNKKRGGTRIPCLTCCLAAFLVLTRLRTGAILGSLGSACAGRTGRATRTFTAGSLRT